MIAVVAVIFAVRDGLRNGNQGFRVTLDLAYRLGHGQFRTQIREERDLEMSLSFTKMEQNTTQASGGTDSHGEVPREPVTDITEGLREHTEVAIPPQMDLGALQNEVIASRQDNEDIRHELERLRAEVLEINKSKEALNNKLNNVNLELNYWKERSMLETSRPNTIYGESTPLRAQRPSEYQREVHFGPALASLNRLSLSDQTCGSGECGAKPRSVLSSKDIDKLMMKDLHGIEAHAGVKYFLQQVRSVGATDEERIALGLARMDKDLRLYVDGELGRYDNPTFDQLEEILRKDFQRPKSAIDAFRELCNNRYHLDDDPREFINTFRIKYRNICRAFPTERLPNEETLWKKVIMDDLPAEMKNRLNICAGEGLADMFITELEKERSFRRVTVAKVKEGDNRPFHRRSPHPQLRVQHCGWCADGSRHLRRDCPRKPEPFSCYDCLKLQSVRGHVGCPGRKDVYEGMNGQHHKA